MIPWLISQQFQDEEFASLSGARVVRIATNPEYSGMGYGSRAMELLRDYYSGKFTDISESTELNDHTITRVTDSELANASLKDEIKLRDVKTLPPLLLKLSEKPLTTCTTWVSLMVSRLNYTNSGRKQGSLQFI